MSTTKARQKHSTRKIILLLIVYTITACSPGKPKPTLQVVYANSIGDSKQLEHIPGLFIELVSPLNCVDLGNKITIYLSIKNQRPYPIVIKKNRKLDIEIQERVNNITVTHLWSQSPDYPINLPAILAPEEEYRYLWQWEPSEVDQEFAADRKLAIRQVTISTTVDVAKTDIPNYSTVIGASIPLFIGAMPWEVGGYAGAIPISCADVLRHTGRLVEK